jgi:beta-lactamase class A
MRRIGAMLLLLCDLGVFGADSNLATKIESYVKAHEGQVAVVVKPLAGSVAYAVNADVTMPTASLIKFPVMVEAYYQFQEGKAKPGDLVILQKDDMVPGAGVLTPHFSPGATFTLRDAIRLMIAFSDNTATNLLLDQIGIRPVNARMESLGLPETRINSKTYKRSTSSVDMARSEKFGLGSTTANEMIRLLTMLHENKLVNEMACKEMTELMLKCEDRDKFPRFLPADTRIAMKTGSVDAVRCAAGIIYVPKSNGDPKKPEFQPIAVCVMTDKNKDERWVPDNAGDLLCAKIAKVVYEHYQR